jgi:hypothetical protein
LHGGDVGVGDGVGAGEGADVGPSVGSVVEMAVGVGVGVCVGLCACVELVGAGADTRTEFVATAVGTPAQPSIHERSMCCSLHRSMQSDGSRLSDPVQSLCIRAVLRGYCAILVVLSDPTYSLCALLA